ncbi:hypothetical protein BO99DRAFT_164847 [Aspergillus violaceofuscus CBS 115571]|uniref:Uncharacterized protein n=1 Tax=Aspergillus violaceofuscus (strain CBS 115571) TaxID=1450538 RepID=A0A2V5H4W1_ASPV1|nr:hypothetical protein BO99DRAFT_164847 [Aspergillus violaceofuscus CBS 115571]
MVLRLSSTPALLSPHGLHSCPSLVALVLNLESPKQTIAGVNGANTLFKFNTLLLLDSLEMNPQGKFSEVKAERHKHHGAWMSISKRPCLASGGTNAAILRYSANGPERGKTDPYLENKSHWTRRDQARRRIGINSLLKNLRQT